MHGGKSTGAPKGNHNRLIHGRYTAKAIAMRKAAASLMRETRELLGRIEGL